MSKGINLQLEFYIKLTQIIGRAFTELQELLASELKRQQQDNQVHIIQKLNCNKVNQKPIQSKLNLSIQMNKQLLHQQIQQNQQKKSIPQQQPEKDKKIENKNKNKNVQIMNNIVQSQIKEKKTKIIKKNIKIKKPSKIKNQNQNRTKRKFQRKKKDNQQGRPYPPLNAFMLFLKDKKHDIMRQRPHLSPAQVSKHASSIWNNFNDKQKQYYIQVYKKNHQLYIQELNNFQNKIKQNIALIQNENEEKASSNDSPFQAQIQQQLSGVKLRSNIRTRRKKRQGTSQIICLESQDDQRRIEYKKIKN